MAGFTVKTSQLHAASEDVAGLQGRCDTIGGDSVTALAQMSANAGHPGLESALAAAAGQASNAFSAAIAVYQHISNSYAASAVNYDAVESGNLAIAKAIQAGLGF